MQFSANLGFLWADRPLPEAIHAAKAAGFDAVECHFPYETPAPRLRKALAETGLPMLSLNTRKGAGFGMVALPEAHDAARDAISEAIGYAAEIGAGMVHVMAGAASGDAAAHTFEDNLLFACDLATQAGITVLIEPLNRYDAPGYFLKTTTQAIEVIEKLAQSNLKLMFDCYHAQITEGDVSRTLARCLPHVGHIQIASVPDRGPPETGELCYKHILTHAKHLGWDKPIGAEYRPHGTTEDSLGWLADFKAL